MSAMRLDRKKYLAPLNVGRLRHPTDSAGFVWRLTDETNNAAGFRPFADPRMAVNRAVWESAETENVAAHGLSAYAFGCASVPTAQLWKTARCAPDGQTT
jgi:hypothetical protein